MEVFLDMEEHLQNIELYLRNGGDSKIANRHRFPTLENRARISYLISKFQPLNPQRGLERQTENSVQTSPENVQNVDTFVPKPPKPKGLGIIAQYPIELHSAYQQAYQLWINVCSLKIQLNAVSRQDEKSSFEIQTAILDKMEIFDKYKTALNHYNEHKRIIATETKSDFSELSPVELITKRNSLRSLITRRKQTISKMESELPEISAPDYYKKISAINRKKEQLQELILDEEKLNGLIK